MGYPLINNSVLNDYNQIKKERKFSVTQLTLNSTTKTTSSLMINITLFSQTIAKLDYFKFSKIVKKTNLQGPKRLY